jgi:carboxymethylenebutenolidase
MKTQRTFAPLLIFIIASILSLAMSLRSPATATSSIQGTAPHQNDYPSPTAIAQVEPKVPVTSESVEYVTIDGTPINGYYAYPQSTSEPLPGIIAIHEWWGLNENIEAMARRLAGEGYQVLAVDLYSGETADSPEVARQLVETASKNPLAAQANLQKAYDYLATEKQAPKVGSIGWCFGGTWSLNTALLLPDELDAAVIYYGGDVGEVSKDDLATLKLPILGIFGAEDESIPVETVKQLQNNLDSLGKTSEFHIYDNAGHAFANPSGQNYVPEAAERAWQETTEFLAEYLKA